MSFFFFSKQITQLNKNIQCLSQTLQLKKKNSLIYDGRDTKSYQRGATSHQHGATGRFKRPRDTDATGRFKSQETQTQQVVSKSQANKNFWDGIIIGITLAGLLFTMTPPTRKVTHEETLEETHEKKTDKLHN